MFLLSLFSISPYLRKCCVFYFLYLALVAVLLTLFGHRVHLEFTDVICVMDWGGVDAKDYFFVGFGADGSFALKVPHLGSLLCLLILNDNLLLGILF